MCIRDRSRQFDDVRVVDAVDMRGVSASQLLSEGKITLAAHSDLTRERMRHREIASAGAVGLYCSFRKVMSEEEGPVLICEQDCYPKEGLADAVREMLIIPGWDVCTFGPLRVRGETEGAGPMRKLVSGDFWGLHATLVRTPRKVMQCLSLPIEMQADAVLSAAASAGLLDVRVEMGRNSAGQVPHFDSSLGNAAYCIKCHISEDGIKTRIVLGTSLVIVIAVLVISIVACATYPNRDANWARDEY